MGYRLLSKVYQPKAQLSIFNSQFSIITHEVVFT